MTRDSNKSASFGESMLHFLFVKRPIVPWRFGKKWALSIACVFFLLANLTARTTVQVYTSMGTFTMQTFEDLAPIPSLNFINLVRNKFYDGMTFDRIVKDSLVQSGDAATNGKPVPPVIKDQFAPTLLHSQAGRVAMVNDGPGTSTSRFAIDMGPAPLLNAHNAVFAQVVTGLNVATAINQVPVDGNNKPLTAIKLDSIRVITDKTPITNVGTDVQFYTNWGTFKVHVYEDIVPITGNNFLTLVKKKYYDGELIDRVAPNWVIQMGNPSTNGKKSEEPTPIPEEYNARLLHTFGGRISMATDGPGTGTSYFAIQLGASPSNNYHYSVFAEVYWGMEIVWAIGGTPIDALEKPLADVHLDSIRIIKAGTVGLAYPGFSKFKSEKNPLPTEYTLTRHNGKLVLNANRIITQLRTDAYDARGKLIFSKSAQHSNQMLLSDKALTVGTYLLKIHDGNATVTLPCDVSAE